MSHLKRTTRIRAPLARVYELAHDPRHWSDWYVGVSDEKPVGVEGDTDERRCVMVGTPFPLTQRVIEDRIGKTEAHWRARVEGPPESVEVTHLCRLLMLSGQSDWAYRALNGETELTVTFDFEVPAELLEAGTDRDTIEHIEAECLERSLENLRRYCEVAH